VKNYPFTQQELNLFKKVASTLHALNLNYWLDQGTLLGAIRSGQLLSWDHDIDLGIMKKGLLPQQEKLVHELRSAGTCVTVMPYVIKISYGPGRRNVDLRIYTEESGYLFTEMWSTADSGNKWKRFRGMIYTVFIYLAHSLYRLGASQNGPGTKWQKALFTMSLKFINYFSDRRESLKNRRTILRVDKSFFSELEKVEFCGIWVPVPRDVENYLSSKYGKDWRTPRKDWHYWLHDGFLHQTETR